MASPAACVGRAACLGEDVPGGYLPCPVNAGGACLQEAALDLQRNLSVAVPGYDRDVLALSFTWKGKSS